MSAPFAFEDFSARDRVENQESKPASAGPSLAEFERAVEAARSEGYETGFKAGWDDAVRAEEETRKRVGATLSRNLQDLGFTFHEARAHVIRAVEPLLTEMTDKVLPELVSQTIGYSVLEEIVPLVEKLSDTPVEIVVCPDNRPAIEEILETNPSIWVEFVEEPSLSEGQVFLRLGTHERKIDLDSAIQTFRGALNAAFTLNKETLNHG